MDRMDREGHESQRLYKKPILPLLLGGSAVHRCDKCHVSNVGFSRRG